MLRSRVVITPLSPSLGLYLKQSDLQCYDVQSLGLHFKKDIEKWSMTKEDKQDVKELKTMSQDKQLRSGASQPGTVLAPQKHDQYLQISAKVPKKSLTLCYSRDQNQQQWVKISGIQVLAQCKEEDLVTMVSLL